MCCAQWSTIGLFTTWGGDLRASALKDSRRQSQGQSLVCQGGGQVAGQIEKLLSPRSVGEIQVHRNDRVLAFHAPVNIKEPVSL